MSRMTTASGGVGMAMKIPLMNISGSRTTFRSIIAVGPEEPENLSRLDLEGDVVDRQERVVAPGQFADFDRCCVHGIPRPYREYHATIVPSPKGRRQ